MAVALTPDANLSRTTSTAWDVYFSWCGWRRIDTDRAEFTILAYLGNVGVGGGFQFTVDDTRQLIVYRCNDFTDLLGGAGPTLAVGDWWFFGITTIAPDEAGNVQIYYAAEGAGSLTQESAYYPGEYQYTRHYVGARPGADGDDGAFFLHGSAALDRTWQNTTLTPAEMLDEYESATAVKSGTWSQWPMSTAATAEDDASGNSRPLTENTGTGSVTTTDDPNFGTDGSATFSLGGTLTMSGIVPPPSGSGAVAISPNAKYRHVPASQLALPVSWCGWVRVNTDLADYTTIVYLGLDSMLRSVILALQPDRTPILYDANYDSDITGSTVAVGTWTFFAVTANTGSGHLRLYQAVEGAALSLVDSGAYDGADFQGGAVELAGRPDGNYPASVALANQRLWTAALTLSELEDEMESESAVRTTGLFGDWAFQDTGTAVDDSSANNNDLTYVAGAGSVATTSGPALGNAMTGAALFDLDGSLGMLGAVSRIGSAAFTPSVGLAAVGAREVVGLGGFTPSVALSAVGSAGVLGAAWFAPDVALSMSSGVVHGHMMFRIGFVEEIFGATSFDLGGTLTANAMPEHGRANFDLGGQLSVHGTRTVHGRIDAHT